MLTPSITNDFSFVVTLELNTSSLVSAFFPPSRSPAPGATTRWCTTSVETAGAGFPFGRCPFHLPATNTFFKRDEQFRASATNSFRASIRILPFRHPNPPPLQQISQRTNQRATAEPLGIGESPRRTRANRCRSSRLRVSYNGGNVGCGEEHLSPPPPPDRTKAHPQSTWGLVSSAWPQQLQYSAGQAGSAFSSKGGIHGGDDSERGRGDGRLVRTQQPEQR